MEFETIEKYLNNLMDPNEKQAFEKKMATDAQFNSEVELHRDIITSIRVYGIEGINATIQLVDEELDREGFFADQEEQGIISEIQTFGQEEVLKDIQSIDKSLQQDNFFDKGEKKPKATVRLISLHSVRPYLAYAATFLLLLVAVWWIWFQPRGPEALYSQYFTVPSEELSPLIEAERAEVGFTQGENELDRLEECISFYTDGNYSRFLESSAELLDLESLAPYRNNLLFYRAVSFMNMDEIDQALSSFDQISEFNDEMLVYQGLALLKNGKLAQAKEVLATAQSEMAMELFNKIPPK